MNWYKANNKELTDVDRLKYEIAEELGLLDKILKCGWGGLTSAESGKIGGILRKRKKDLYKGDK